METFFEGDDGLEDRVGGLGQIELGVVSVHGLKGDSSLRFGSWFMKKKQTLHFVQDDNRSEG